jgi:uncharacterized membrane protein
MGKGRLEAFTDGVLAIILTIMVLELKVPSGSDRSALLSTVPILLTYALSYVNVGIFWNNHHHMLHATERVNGAVLWANLALLFWMSLIPFVIRWMNETRFAAMPTAAYGVVLILSSVSYLLLEGAIIRCNGPDSKLARAVGNESKGKLSLTLYLLAVPLAFVRPWIAIAVYSLVATMWFIPDKRIEALADL